MYERFEIMSFCVIITVESKGIWVRGLENLNCFGAKAS